MSCLQEKFAVLQESARRLRHTTAAERTDRLKALLSVTLARQKDLFQAGYSERGTHDLDIAAELMMVKTEIDHIVKNLPLWMRPHKVKGSLGSFGKKCEIRYQSKGVVLNMAAYNAPTVESIVPLAAAIAAGNAVVLKPSEYAPASAQILKEIFETALSVDEVAVCLGEVETAQALLALPFSHIYYTGGNAVGKIVMKAAADHFASVTLEMGGKCPVIIDETADIENAATKISWGRNLNAGQGCICPEYVLVHESRYEVFLEHITQKIHSMYNDAGTGFEHSDYFPRIINAYHHKRIAHLIKNAVDKGAEIVCGGNCDADERFIAPTVLTGLTETMDIMKEEVFGPVLTVHPYQAREEVLDMIALRPNPLALYIYSKNKSNIEYFLNTTSSGSVVINNNCVQAGTNPNLPFGGIGASGNGRIGGFAGFKEMSNARSIVYQPLDRFRDFLIMLPPYSDRYKNIIMKAIK